MTQQNITTEQQLRENYKDRDPLLVDLIIELKKKDTKNLTCFGDEWMKHKQQ